MQTLITYKNKTQTIKAWSKELNISYSMLVARITKRHWSIERAFTELKGSRKGQRLVISGKLNHVFRDMKDRCYNPNRKDYKWYGAKGIKICDEWLNGERVKGGRTTKGYLVFQEWALSHGFSESLTIDRIDPSKDYTPDNCRWITIEEQQRNKSSNFKITYKGKTQTLAEWSRELGMWHGTIRHRLCKLHWDVEKAFETPTKNGGLKK